MSPARVSAGWATSRPFGLPGGEAAVTHPVRIAYSILGPREAREGGLGGLEQEQQALVQAMLEKGVNCPACTSLGRLFDAAAAILGSCRRGDLGG